MPAADDKRARKLVPEGLATKRERGQVDDKTLERASAVRAHAARLSKPRPPHLRLVTDESWLEHRHELGEARDLERAMVLIMSATGYKPLPAQEDMHFAAPPEGEDRVDKFYCGGIGTGKSTFGMIELIKAILLNPGVRSLVVAPTYDQCLHVLLPTFLAFCEKMEVAGYPILKRFRWSQMRAELVCGGEVFFRSVSKVDNLLGFEFAIIHFDESETVANPEIIWMTLSGRLRQKAHFRQFVCTSTPRGLRGVIGIFQTAREDFKDEAEKQRLRERFFFVRSTTLDNPYLPPDYIENLRRTLSKAAWDQEVLAKILRPEAAVYSEFERARHEFVWREGKAKFVEMLAARGVEYDVVYDPGQTYAHVLWIARFADMDVVFDEICEDNITVDKLHAEIIARCLRLRRPPSGFVLDRAVKRERAWAWEAFPQSAIMICESRTEQSIVEGISVVKNLLDPMVGEPRLRFASFLWDRMPRRAIVKCMMHYSYDKTASGTLSRMPKKDNTYDHGADSIRMWGVKRHGDAYRYAVIGRRYAA